MDQDPTPGRFILTGSQQFGLPEAITQSLAGRIGQLHLLPLSLDEVRRFPSYPADLWESVFMGGYPRIYDRSLEPTQWLGDYIATYVQGDVRQVLNVTDLDAFTPFLRLAAARTGQELKLAGLGADAGVTHNTARAWVSVLEASFIVFWTPAWHRNLRKRAIRTAKLHFVDSGLACWQPEPARLPGPILLRGPGSLKFARLGQALEDVLDVIAWWKTPGHRANLRDNLVAVRYQEGLPCFNRT